MAAPPSRAVRLRRPALVRLRSDGGVAAGLRLPINPERLERTVEAGPSGAPRETIRFLVPLDAGDGLEGGDRRAPDSGVLAPLAALERLMSPPGPGEGPTVLVWGDRRVPVRLTRLDVAEEAFDARLVTLRASVAVTCEVLADLPRDDPGRPLLDAHHRRRRGLARGVVPRGLDDEP